MAPYRVTFLPSAVRELAALRRGPRRQIAQQIEALMEGPRPSEVRVLPGGEGLLRLRVEEYRIIYRVDDLDRAVLVVKIGRRRPIKRRGE